MMDESVRPGDGNRCKKCSKIAKIVGLILLCIVLYPFALVLYVPLGGMIIGVITGYKICKCVGALILGIVGFIIGLILNVCFIPVALIGTVVFLLFMLVRGVILCLSCCCASDDG